MPDCDQCTQHSKVEQVMEDFQKCQEKKGALWDEINALRKEKLSAAAFYSIITLLLTIGLGIAGYIAYAQNSIAADVAKMRSEVAVNTDNVKDIKDELKEFLK